jgi:hypothetical protein
VNGEEFIMVGDDLPNEVGFKFVHGDTPNGDYFAAVDDYVPKWDGFELIDRDEFEFSG